MFEANEWVGKTDLETSSHFLHHSCPFIIFYSCQSPFSLSSFISWYIFFTLFFPSMFPFQISHLNRISTCLSFSAYIPITLTYIFSIYLAYSWRTLIYIYTSLSSYSPSSPFGRFFQSLQRLKCYPHANSKSILKIKLALGSTASLPVANLIKPLWS